ncbi:MAG: phosphoheptose isomerase [Deltaproteobacteria bacterium]|nr:phosphoheptose isomerase [Deltaproteobacteria bacterium]
MAQLKTFLFDIDGTICSQCEGDYENLTPFKDAIELINKLYEKGHKINFYTSRFMGRNNNDIIKVYKEGYSLTLNQLKAWGVKFHELYMGKPRCDIMIDDKALFFSKNWKAQLE